MKVKICGLRRIEDIDYINEFLPDYAGFIFAKKSKRYIEPDFAIQLKNKLNTKIKSVGVFVNENIEIISQILDLKIIDLIQLHGDEDNIFIEQIKKLANLPVIKAFRAENDLKTKLENSKADYFLIDSSNKNSFGGTGMTFDWNIIPDEYKNKIFLAGGLNKQNISQAITTVSPYCLDINSGVETDGFKDKIKIKEIFEIIKENKNE